MSTLEERLLDFVRGELLADRDLSPERIAAIDADTYLFEDGLIDSLNILQLIAFLERELQRDIPETEVVMANFKSVRIMARRFGEGSRDIASETYLNPLARETVHGGDSD